MINSVRNTVLSVLNKNNYGYISPSDFNLFSKQAQLEIFEDYFKEYNKTINLENARASGVDYADQKRIVEDAIETFAEFRLLSLSVGIAGESTFSIPSPTTTGDVLYVINKIIYYTDPMISGVNTAVVINELDDTSVDFIALGVVPGDIVTTGVNGVFAIVNSVSTATRLVLSTNLFSSVGLTYYIQPTRNFKEIDKVNLSVINSLRLSNLTSPSTMFPVYTHRGVNLIVYPDSISSFGQVRASYFRLPNDPKWTYTSLVGGQPSFDQSQLDYQDFELPLEDEYKLCTKILQYCGLSIREAEIVQYMTGKEIQEKQS
jgi:hypothetical protein